MAATSINGALLSDILVDKVIEAFTAEITPLRAFSTDFSPETEKKGNVIEVPIAGNITASGNENAYETEDSAGLTAAKVTLDKYAKATVAITDAQAANSPVAKLDKFATQQAKAVARKILSEVWGLITGDNFSAFVNADGTIVDSADIRALRKDLSQAKVPRSERSLILNSDSYDFLFDSAEFGFALLTALAYGGTEAIRQGHIPRLLGFNLYESQLIPEITEGFNHARLQGFGVHPAAIAVAIRPLRPQAGAEREYLETRVITDSDTGISLGYRRHYNPGTGKHYCTFEAVYGAGVGLPTALVRLLDANPNEEG